MRISITIDHSTKLLFQKGKTDKFPDFENWMDRRKVLFYFAVWQSCTYSLLGGRLTRLLVGSLEVIDPSDVPNAIHFSKDGVISYNIDMAKNGGEQ
jgi:hypothetical protein